MEKTIFRIRSTAEINEKKEQRDRWKRPPHFNLPFGPPARYLHAAHLHSSERRILLIFPIPHILCISLQKPFPNSDDAPLSPTFRLLSLAPRADFKPTDLLLLRLDLLLTLVIVFWSTYCLFSVIFLWLSCIFSSMHCVFFVSHVGWTLEAELTGNISVLQVLYL